jgi:thiamine-phosphate pyrophosphorylase
MTLPIKGEEYDMTMKTIYDCYLYALTPPDIGEGTSSLDRVKESIINQGHGIDALQLRIKKKNDRQILDLGRQIRQLTLESGVLMIMNDRLDLCQILDADGLHLGQDDIPLEEARKILGSGKIIGISTHTLAQAYEAEQKGADYLGYGPCYPTSTKGDLSPRIAFEEIGRLRQTLKIPFFIIGGLSLENLPPALAAGANRIAICAGIYQTGNDVRQTIRKVRQLLGREKH